MSRSVGSASLGHAGHAVASQQESVAQTRSRSNGFSTCRDVAHPPVGGRYLEGRYSLLCSLSALFRVPYSQDASARWECPPDRDVNLTPGCERLNLPSLLDANHEPPLIGVLSAGSWPGQEGRDFVRPRWCQPRPRPRHLPPCGRSQQGVHHSQWSAHRQQACQGKTRMCLGLCVESGC